MEVVSDEGVRTVYLGLKAVLMPAADLYCWKLLPAVILSFTDFYCEHAMHEYGNTGYGSNDNA